jgi:hypothetical protein
MAAAQRSIQKFRHVFGQWMARESACPVALASLAITFGAV